MQLDRLASGAGMHIVQSKTAKLDAQANAVVLLQHMQGVVLHGKIHLS